jgi:hypothetical protein
MKKLHHSLIPVWLVFAIVCFIDPEGLRAEEKTLSRLLAHENYQGAVAMGIVEGLEKCRFAVRRKPQVKSEAAPERE